MDSATVALFNLKANTGLYKDGNIRVYYAFHGCQRTMRNLSLWAAKNFTKHSHNVTVNP